VWVIGPWGVVLAARTLGERRSGSAGQEQLRA
jgi:hypothetical protein